jgi:hypothetical protein
MNALSCKQSNPMPLLTELGPDWGSFLQKCRAYGAGMARYCARDALNRLHCKTTGTIFFQKNAPVKHGQKLATNRYGIEIGPGTTR